MRRAAGGCYDGAMPDSEEEAPPTYPPGFEPPTDIDVPWYSWVIYPVAIIVALLLVAFLFRGCAGGLT